jgi:hypothetical protein
VTRVAIAAVVVAFASAAHAETTASSAPAPKPAAASPKPASPDEIADIESREANLEPKEPRKDFTLAAAAGGDIMLGGDIGVGRGPWLSLRLGHVATRKTVITFELNATSGLHKAAMTSETLTDSIVGLFAGAQRYTSGSFWVRAAGGPAILVTNIETGGSGDKPIAGLGGLVGGGLDLARWGYLVVGLEGFGTASVSRDGLKAQLAFGLGISYY